MIFEKQYHQYCLKYSLDPKYGYLVPPDHEPTNFDVQTLLNLCQIWKNLNDVQKEARMAAFPSLHVTSYANHKDNFTLHDMLTCILNIHLTHSRQKGLKDNEIVLHPNLCQPLYEVSTRMEIKPAMVANIASNWIPNNRKHLDDPANFSLDDFELRWTLTDNEQQEKYFFGASIVGSFHMARIMRAFFEIQSIIETSPEKKKEVISSFGTCVEALNKIISEVMSMYEKLDANYFYFCLRPMITGYTDLLFLGVEQNKQVRLSMPGGTAGYDPSFQLFESALGIKFQGDYKSTQQALFRQGMCWHHKQAILGWRNCYMENHPNIRSYCCSEGSIFKQLYNQVLRKYKQFLGLHSLIVKKYIMNNIPAEFQQNAKGTGNTLISKIMLRYQVINQFMLQ